jgi:Fe2+ or Zn2+ uptake regulation protein
VKNAHAVLRQHSLRATPQRVVVYESIAQLKGHSDVETIYGKVRSKIPNISLATVYAIVESFRKAGIVAEVSIDNGKAAYEQRTDSHHHFMCQECGKVYDLDIPLCETVRCGCAQGHEIRDFHGYFYGVCKACKDMRAQQRA